ncbi:MAG: hypothetical protein V4843_02815 [Pseudomonadota bacterium]|uniref:hypothetical protein n=1 Tax=unclassified Acidovorax TaxID=2684926 RepID=UPI0007B53252|nr:hypothetical protein [Acidovorax sp. GW101-3H11]KZT13741.1 hypothetical protein A1D30_21760 [Acidovorax sp. GW101-3H11]MBD9395593.1 hypothetical protein [Acidovorax sp. ACV01]
MNDPLLYEDELDAAKDAVKALGGAKKVGPLIWPDKAPETAARHLLDCLNGSRAERLSPSQLLLLMRLAREVGFHGLTAYLLREAGYAPPVPVEPQTEAQVLARQMEAMVGQFSALTHRLERLTGAGRG